MAASVSTRVVSWKEAAEMKLSVDSERLGNAQQDVGVGRGDLAFALDGLVGVEDLRALDLLALDVAGLARVLHHHATQHLAHDHFNVLVVDLHTLQAVHVLHFIDDVAGQLFDAQQAQDVLRIGRAVHDVLALVHHLACQGISVRL